MNTAGNELNVFSMIKVFKKFSYFLILIFGALVFQYNKDAAIIIGCSAIIFLSFIIDNEKTTQILPAFCVAAVWLFLSKDQYSGYNVFKLNIFGISVFPVLAWPTGLYLFHLLTGDLFPNDIWWKKWFKLSFIYSIGIIIFEFIGYNVFNVHLNAGSAYPGWPILNIFHCVWWMQIAYFANGIIYLLLVNTREHYSWSVRRTFAYVYMYFR